MADETQASIKEFQQSVARELDMESRKLAKDVIINPLDSRVKGASNYVNSNNARVLFDKQKLIQGIILSEILGKPTSKRKRRRR